jgi:hypothetical protein
MNTIEQNVLNLNQREIDRLFRLLTDNADILTKVIPNVPFLEYIANGTVFNNDANPTIQAYQAWKNKNN